MAENDSFLTALGLARRAGKLIYGFDAVMLSAESIRILFVARDISPNTRQNIEYRFRALNKDIVAVNYDKAQLGYALGIKPVGILGITEKGFAKLLKDKLDKSKGENQ